MPYASTIQVVNDANGAAYAFLADNGSLWQCQWNAQAERWDQGQVVPGAYGARDLQALVVSDLWPTAGSNGAVPGNTPGVVLAYRLGSGASAQVMASFGAWNSDGSLRWSEAVALSGDQGEDQAFSLGTGATAGTVKVVFQKREASPSPQDLLAEFRQAPGELLSQQLDALASGARIDSDLYVSTLRINAAGNGDYTLQLSATTGNTQTTTLTAATTPQVTAPPATASGGNTSLSRAALATNAAPESTPVSARQASPQLLGASAPTSTSVSFAQASSASTSSQGFGFTRYVKNPASLASLGLVPWRYMLGTALSKTQRDVESLTNFNPDEYIVTDGSGDSEFDGRRLSTESNETIEEEIGNVDEFEVNIRRVQSGNMKSRLYSSLREVERAASFASEPGLTGGSEDGDKKAVASDQNWLGDSRELVFKGLFGGLLAGRGGYTVANFSTLSYVAGGQNTSERANDLLGNIGVKIGQNPYDTDWLVGAAVSGSLKTLYQFSSKGAMSRAGLLSFAAQQSVGMDFSVYKANLLASGQRRIFEAVGGLYALMEQRYYSADGLPNWLRGIGLFTGLTGDAFSLAMTLGGLEGSRKSLMDSNINSKPFHPFQFNGLSLTSEGFNSSARTPLLLANYTGFLSAALSASTVIGAASSAFNQYGTASWGLGSQQTIRLRVLSKYGLGLELIGGAQENTLWNFKGIQPVPDEQILVFGSVGAAVALGGYIPLLQSSWTWNSKPSITSSAAPDTDANGAPSLLAAPTQTPVSNGNYVEAPTGSRYPFGYAPASATDALLVNASGPLTSLTANPSQLILHQLQAFAASTLSPGMLKWANDGAGTLNDGTYTNIPLIGLSLPGSSGATASFTVSQGSIVAGSFAVQLPSVQSGSAAPGQYLSLPEPSSGNYAFGLDVFQALPGNPAPPAASNFSSVHSALPLFTLDTNLTGSPLRASAIQRIQQQLSLTGLIQSGDYPTADDSSTNPNDSSVTTLSKVPVLLSSSTSASISPLNPAVTATVKLSGGSIIAANLDQPLYFAAPSAASYSLVLDLASSLGVASIVNPSLSVTPQAEALNDFTDQESFTANPTANNAGVFLTAGLSDQLPLLSSYAHWPVQNRVAYVDGDTIVYLNNTGASSSGSWKAVYASDLTLKNLYENPNAYQFTAASEPTAITDTTSGTTYVFWVEASEPVTPLTGSDGEANYQEFMNALYGKQRINYSYGTVNESGTNTIWNYINSTDLYVSTGNIITNLRAFNVQIDVNGSSEPRALLVWTELPISAVQNAAANPSDLADSPLAKIKVGLINPNAATDGYAWNQLFTDQNGNSTIATIPWTSDSGSGLSIADISAAMQLIQVPSAGSDASQTVQAPVLSWSQAVRTPYNEAVLNSQPVLFVPLGALQTGSNELNIGSASVNTETFASSTGLNTAIAGALPKSSASAVQNVEGLGVLVTGLGTTTKPILDQLRNIPQADRNSAQSDPVAIFSGTITGTTLTVSELSQGSLAVGELLVGAGVAAGTTISAIILDATSTTTGYYTLSTSNSLASTTTLRAMPEPTPYSYSSFSGSFSGEGGSSGYTTLHVSNLTGPLLIGDRVLGLGLAGGSFITQVQSFDASSGSGVYILNQGPQSAAGSYGLAALPGGSASPYSIEFWTQLAPGSNPAGAGLVTLGQASAAALPDRPAAAPEGWLLSSSFAVERLTWKDALKFALASSLPSGTTDSDLYGWRWALVADGANTTAMAGNGGSNLNRNALVLDNLFVGDRIGGVNTFLANYGLSSSDLLGIDGTPADQIAAVPTTQFQFTTDLSLNAAVGQQVASTSLNGLEIDTSSAVMNGGLVLAATAATNASLTSMFETLWQFQQQTGEAKVNFSLDPTSQTTPPAPSTPPLTQIEAYNGFALQFALLPGPAVSVNGSGQIAFDVAPGQTLLSPVGTDLRDGSWHYVLVSFLPDYVTYTADGTLLDVPSNVGTASLYIDGQLVGSVADVVNPYAPSNINDYAQLLSDNATGAIDLLALYGQALSTSSLPTPADSWPLPTSQDALALMKEAGFVIATKTPHPGALPGAVSNHWLAHTVDPNNALNSTYTSTLIPNGSGGGTWSQATALNPLLAPQPTTPSASTTTEVLQDLVIAIQSDTWAKADWFSAPTTTSATSTTAAAFNPAGKELETITVTLTPSSGSDTVTRTLNPGQVMLGSNPLSALQPLAEDSDFNYTFLSNTPALNLLISREAINSGDKNKLEPKLTYTAEVKLTFSDNSTVSNISSGGTTGLSLGFSNSLAAELNTTSSDNRKALATAALVEQAPLQLKYVDSGEIFRSQNSVADDSPASSFAMAQVAGYYANSNGSTQNGWLAIAQPRSTNAPSDPAGRVWINYTGQFTLSSGVRTAVSSDAANAPTTWLNALAGSNFSPQAPNLPLLNDALYQSSVGGLLIKADPSAGWGQNFGSTMLVADVNDDGVLDLIIAAPQANSGGAVVIVDGKWISSSLTASTGQTILDLSNPSNLGAYVTVLTPGTADTSTDITTVAGFGSALAFDTTTNTLWIGAPNYLRTLDSSNKQDSTQPIGALYSYNTTSYSTSWGKATPTSLTSPILGTGGTVATTQAGNTTSTTYWGSQLGSAVAISSGGELAVSAPGVVASMVYSGTETANQKYNLGNLNFKPQLPDGLLTKIQVGGTAIDATGGVNNPLLSAITSLTSGDLSKLQLAFLNKLADLLSSKVSPATTQNNQAIQAAAVGAVLVFKAGTSLSSLANTAFTPAEVASLSGTIYYGPNPYNTLGDSGFGSSLSFADLSNKNSPQLIIGAPQSSGGGMVYTIDFSSPGSDTSLGNNQYLASLAATNLFMAAESFDGLGNGLVNLGDVNQDGYEDVLLQAYNAASGAGNGYLLFGSDTLSSGTTNQGLASLASGSIGTISFADGSSKTIAILSELGSAGSLAGQGSYGSGDINADGYDDILMGSGALASAYLTWGHPYLEAISNLQLNRLTSSNGFMLDGLATTNQGTLRSIGDFNGDGYGDFISVNPSNTVTNVRIELGANTEEILADAPYSYYSFTVTKGTEVLAAGDVNGDGLDDIALFLDTNLSTTAEGNKGAGSTTGILYGRSSDDLPLGSGFGFLAAVDTSTNAPLASLPGVNLNGGLTDAAPSVIAVGTTLYAAVKGVGSTDTTLWFTQSNDGGNTWNSWTDLSAGSSAFATAEGIAPSLAYFNNKLYLGFVNSAGTLSLSSWDPSSNNPMAWSAPSALATSSGATSSFTSSTAPQLLDRGDSLGVMWVEGGTVYASSSIDPAPTPATAPWAVVNGGSSMATPALVRDGDTVYMAVQAGSGGNRIYWTSSSDGGSTWAAWQALPASMTSVSPPSLAMISGTLYLSYLGVGNNQINITSLSDAATNTWTSVYQIPGQSATYASLVNETVAGTTQLAVYYVSNDATDRILKAYTTTPASSTGWTSDIQIQYGNNAATQTASSPLALSQYNGQTYLVYQGGTTTSSSNEIYIATSSASSLNNGAEWSAQALLDPSTRSGLGLTTTADGLLLSYGNSTTTSELQLTVLTPQSGSLNVSQGTTKTLPLVSSLSNNIAILSGESKGFSNLLLAGINTAANSNSVQTSLVYAAQDDKSWIAPLQLQVLQDGSATTIAATEAPSFTWLGSTPVMAVNDAGTVRVYAGIGSGSSLQLASSFTAPSDGLTIVSAPVLTTTDTGLALTYTNSDGSISLQRLDVLTANGTPVEGVQVNSDGSVDLSNADLSWQSTVLTTANSGLDSSLATVPVSVSGNLLLANVRNSSSDNTEIWINAVPNLSDPESTTWLNSSVQLPNGSGGWTLQQQSGTVAIGTFTPSWATDEGGLSPSAPAFAELNGVLYAAVVGYNSSTGANNGLLYWNSSTDGGRTWSAWQQVPNYASNQAPALAAFQGAIYMAYVGTNTNLYIASLTDSATNTWSQDNVSGQTCKYVGLTVENGDLAAYYVGTNGDLYRTASDTPLSGGSWSASMLIKYSNGNQTASGNLAVTTAPIADGTASTTGSVTTYIAYQGGTPSSPSDTLYLTSSSDPSSSSSWSDPRGTPQPTIANRGGVTLTHNNSGLLLGFADKLNGEVVYVVQQSSDSGSVWSPFTTLAAPTGVSLPSSGSNTSFSLMASAISNDVLVGAINNASGANSAINLSVVSELPPSTSLSSSQTASNLSAVGDLNGDGFDDLVVAANNVVVNPSSTAPTLATGLRLITGAANSSQITANNAAGSSTQTVQLAPWNGVNNSTPVASLSGPDKLSVTTAASVSGQSLTSHASLSDAAVFTATAGDLATAQTLFPTNTATTLGPIPAGPTLGNLGLISSAAFGDLNGDGAVDYLDPAALTVVQGANGQSWNLWSIRAAGDVNGNGVDDVLLSLAPQGPAYGQVTSGQPSALQSALVDGSLFEVKNNQFSLALAEGSADGGWTTAGLRTPLNPYTRSQLYDIASTATSAYEPALQNWFDPILGFKPGSLTAASTDHGFNPDSAESYTSPAVAVSPEGAPYLVFSGHDNSSSGSGIWIAYRQADGSWNQANLSVGSNACILSPSAVFYQGKLTIAYTDVNGYLHVAWCEGSPQDSSAKWSNYQVKTTAEESSQWNPTLVVEAGRLALYFPSNSGKTVQQNIRYLYSTDPFDTSSYGNWGSTINSSKTGYSGISGTINVSETPPIVTSPIAATTFQGRTVLAFRSYVSGSGSNVDNGNILLLTQVATAATASEASTTINWVQTDTSQSNSNGVGLATDQALLYLTSTTYPTFNFGNPSPMIWSLAPSSAGSGEWTLGTEESVNGPGYAADFYNLDNPFTDTLLLPSVLTPFLLNGKLMAAWSGGYGSNIGNQFDVQLAELEVTIGDPSQQSLAGYSLDGNIDINGDGFRDVLLSDPSDAKEFVNNQYALFGGDYLNIASQVGTTGDDELVGTSLADVIYSIGGSDSVLSNGGADVIYTGAGDDKISITGNAFLRIDAGSGFDVLQLAGSANQAYDFRLNVTSPVYFAGTKLKDIELIDSRDYGANTLSFDEAAVNAINADRILFVTPDSADSIQLSSAFQRNSAFDTTFGGSLWSAYAAGTATTPAQSSPALLYVLNPSGASATDWLSQNVLPIDGASRLSASAGGQNVGSAVVVPSATALIGSSPFGDGLSLLAYQVNPLAGEARFAIERLDGRQRQVVSYASSSANSTAEPGRHYDPIAGLLAFEIGELRKEITVPILAEAFAALGGASLSLEVEEWQEARQHPLHLVLSLDPDAADARGWRPSLSGASLTPASSNHSAFFTFRADTNGSSGGASALRFQMRLRSDADSRDSVKSQQIEILDEVAAAEESLILHLANRVGVSLDRDQRVNQQVSARLELLFSLDRTSPTVSDVATPTTSGLYGIGTVIPITVTFSEAVTVDTSAGLPSLLLETGASDRQAVYSSGSGSRTLTFLYTVQAGDRTPQLAYTSANALVLNGATIQDAAGNNADLLLPAPDAAGSLAASAVLLIDGVAPVATSIASANANGTYGPGALITLTARFTEPVRVNLSGGVPSLLLETGAVDRAASYISGSGTDTLVFGYTVQNGDTASDLDLAANTSLALNGATLQDAAGNPADLTLPAPGAPGSLAANAALVIIGVTPQSLVISTATAVLEEGATLAVSVRSETLAAGTSLYWRFSGSGITAADFSPAGLGGSIPLGSDRRAALSRSIALDALPEGDEQLTLEFFADAARSQSLGRALFTLREVAPKTLAGATDGRDLLIGTAADELISGVPVVSALQGRGSYDTLTGNGGSDLFILGTAAAAFYDDGIRSTAGASDLAAITDFAAGDRLQLHGSAADYRLANGRVAGSSGVMVYRLMPASGSTPAGSDELIGFLKGLTPASLNLTDPNQFLYV